VRFSSTKIGFKFLHPDRPRQGVIRFIVLIEEETDMTPTYKLEMQCTHAEFLRELPAACGNRPYEIIGNKVIVYDRDREIRFQIRDEPIRHLGSLALPMEAITVTFVDFNNDEAERFMSEFRKGIQREGG
jgi:hypothetical protein